MSSEQYDPSQEIGRSQSPSLEELTVMKKILIEAFLNKEDGIPFLVVEDINEEGLRVLSRRQLLPVVLAEYEENESPEDTNGNKIIPPEVIIARVAADSGYTIDELKGKRQSRDAALNRHLAMYLIRQLTPLSYEAISALFGGRDHSTAVHAVKNIAQAAKDARRQTGEKVAKLEAELQDPNRILSAEERNLILTKTVSRLVVLCPDGLVVCSCADNVDGRSRLLATNDKVVLDWQSAREDNDLYEKYANIAYKLLRSI